MSTSLRSKGSQPVRQRILAVAARLPVGLAADVLAMAAVCPDSVDLIETNPALAVCVAAGFARKRAPETSPRIAWIGRKRRELCSRLGFPDSGQTVRVLAKIRPEHAAPWRVNQLKEPLRDHDVQKLLSHTRSIKIGHIVVASFLEKNHGSVSQPLFEHLAEMRDEHDVRRACEMLTGSVWLREQIGAGVPLYSSLEQLVTDYAKLIKRAGLKGRKPENPLRLPFPAQPVPSTEGIEPITSPADLRAEGETMHHCVVDYWTRVALGKSYFYRMLRPIRATIELRPRNGRWQMHAARGEHNKPLGEKAHNVIRSWLHNVDVGADRVRTD